MFKRVLIVICAITVLISCVFDITRAFAIKEKRQIIVIDAGHGGFDSGCIGIDGTLEKDINLAVSLKLNEVLIQLGFNTVLIRGSDCSVESRGASIREKKKSDIQNRFSYLSKYSGCVYLSIHQNQYSSASVKGGQMFYTPTNDKSKLLAESLQTNIANLVQKYNNRKIKPCTKDVYIVHYAPRDSTAVLVECGFLSNYNDLNQLKDPKYQSELSLAIALGLLDWIRL